ncbi:retrovirus-related pol polyprotein from transposon TNT 1-94 [Tanacetum coccineum]
MALLLTLKPPSPLTPPHLHHTTTLFPPKLKPKHPHFKPHFSSSFNNNPETNCPVPQDQQPINEYQITFSTHPKFVMASDLWLSMFKGWFLLELVLVVCWLPVSWGGMGPVGVVGILVKGVVWGLVAYVLFAPCTWDFHRPLHVAGHFLNPQWFYDKSKNVDCEEIRTGLSACIRRLVPDLRIQDAIADELDLYQKEARMFGDPMEIRHRSTKAPADWWVAYGSSAPNLQKFAIRVLSLTCSATGYIDESNEWLMGHMDGEEEPATNFVYVDDDLTWAAVDIASGASEPAYPTRASTSRGSVQGSTSAPKGKGTAHTSTSGSKAYGLIDEDYEEDIGLSEDDGVNEELGIDVDDDEHYI